MTTNASLVSNRTTQPASAIQARANSQSAAIALLGAGTSSPNQGESSFADSLESESKRQTSPQGLFSDNANSARKPLRSDNLSSSNTKQDDARNPSSPAKVEDDSRPVTKSSRTRKAESPEPEDLPLATATIPSDSGPKRIADLTQPNAPVAGAVNPAIPNQKQETNAAVSEEPTAENAKSAPAEQKTRQPTDPLRLIVPQQQAAAEDAPINAQSPANQAAAQTAGQIATVNQSNLKQVSIRANEKSNASGSVGATTPTNATMAAGMGIPLNTGANAAAPSGQPNGAVAGISAASGAGGGATGGTPLDQVTPPRTGGGKPIEHPVTLKLKMAPPTSNNSPQLSETEITAAETQIGRGLTAAFRQNTPQVTLWMSPETLGKVRIQLTFDQGTISARFEATSDATKDLLSQNMGALRDALQSRGLTATQIEVVSIPDWSHQNTGSQNGSNEGRSANHEMQNQSSSGGNLPFGQGGQQQQGTPEHSRGWAALPQGNETTPAPSSSDTHISMSMDPRLMTLKAHLELDAVA